MSIDQLQTMQVIRGKRTMLGPEDAGHTGLFHAAPGRPRKVDKVGTMRHSAVSVSSYSHRHAIYTTRTFSPSLGPLIIRKMVFPLHLESST